MPKKYQESKKHFQEKGKKALLLNIIFFAVFFPGVLLVIYTGFAPTAIIIFLIFIASMLYLYRT